MLYVNKPQRRQEQTILFGMKQEQCFLERNKNDPFWKVEQNKNTFWNLTIMIRYGNWNETRTILFGNGKWLS